MLRPTRSWPQQQGCPYGLAGSGTRQCSTLGLYEYIGWIYFVSWFSKSWNSRFARLRKPFLLSLPAKFLQQRLGKPYVGDNLRVVVAFSFHQTSGPKSNFSRQFYRSSENLANDLHPIPERSSRAWYMVQINIQVKNFVLDGLMFDASTY